MEFKLMSVTTDAEKQHAKIMITESWLDRFGFSLGMLVTVSCQNDVLTFKAQGFGLDIYRRFVGEVREQKGQMLQVFNWTRKKTETHLVLEGTWLERQGFIAGDIILAGFELGLIRIKHVPLNDLGFSENVSASYRNLTVQTSYGVPQINLNGRYLEEHGFFAGRMALVTYEPNGVTFQSLEETSRKRTNKPMPFKINIQLSRKASCLSLNGLWLLKLGYQPDDFLILECQPNHLKIRRLEQHFLQF